MYTLNCHLLSYMYEDHCDFRVTKDIVHLVKCEPVYRVYTVEDLRGVTRRSTPLPFLRLNYLNIKTV